MTYLLTFLRWSLAFVLALVMGILFVVGVGMFAPVLLMNAIYGSDAVMAAPGHGSAILFLTVPLTGIVALVFLLPLTAMLATKFNRSR
jgi:hypothetical protein